MKASRLLALLPELSRTGAPRLTLDILQGLGGSTELRLVSWQGGPLESTARGLGQVVVLRGGVAQAAARLRASEHVAEALAGISARLRAVVQAGALRRRPPDLVYASSVTTLPLLHMLRLENVPVVLHVHEMGSALAWFERGHPGLIRDVPTRYVAVSAAVGRDLAAFGVPRDRITVVRSYVLPPLPASDAMRPVERPYLVVGGAGNPSWTKGLDLWLLTARQVVDLLGTDRVRFVWVGYRDNLEGLRFRTMVTRLGLDGVVELVRETDRAYEHFDSFDVFAMTSWEDSAPLVVLETMAMGIPTVCFAPTGGSAEEVGEAGVVLEGISTSAMAEAIVDLLRSPERRMTMGDACRARVATEFRRDRTLQAVSDVFDAAVSRQPARD